MRIFFGFTFAALSLALFAGEARAVHKQDACATSFTLAGTEKTLGEIPSDCRQAVAVVSSDWNASVAEMRRFSRADGSAPWMQVGSAAPVLIGKRGMGWAAGLQTIPNGAGPLKTEGDRRSPAGMFLLKEVFFRRRVDSVHMPSILITAATEAIDDPRSRYYNQIVDRSRIANPDWHSSERMAGIIDYALGIVVGANPARTAGAGSCIFLHLWSGVRKGTSGCTALHRKDLMDLVQWLDPDKAPILIQAPVSEFVLPSKPPRRYP